MSNEIRPGSASPESSSPAYNDPRHSPLRDELSLADLVRALGRRWRWIAGCALLALLLAAAYAIAKTPEYRYSIAVAVGEIPRTDTEGNTVLQPVEAPATVVAHLEASVIPGAIRKTLSLTDGDIRSGADIPELTANNPAGTTLVRIAVDGPDNRAEQYRRILSRAATAIVRDHVSNLEAVHSAARSELSRLQNRQEQLEAHLETIKLNLERLTAGANGGSVLVAMRASELGQNISETRADLLAAEDQAKTVRERIQTLEAAIQRFQVPVSAKALKRQREITARVNAVTNGLRPTRALHTPERSLEPVGISDAVVVALAVILGLGGGLVLALFVDAVRRDSTYA